MQNIERLEIKKKISWSNDRVGCLGDEVKNHKSETESIIISLV